MVVISAKTRNQIPQSNEFSRACVSFYLEAIALNMTFEYVYGLGLLFIEVKKVVTSYFQIGRDSKLELLL